MRSRIAPLLLVPLLCLAPRPARADAGVVSPADNVWMTVLLNGRKVGQEHVQREQQGDTVVTTQTLMMDIERNHKRTPYINVSRNVETLDGTPISFSMTTTLSAVQTRVDGRRSADGTLELVNSAGDSSRHTSTAWPAGAMLVEGERLVMRAAMPYPGKHYHLLVYNQASQEAMDLAVEVIGNERVDMPDGVEILSHQRETLRNLDNTQSVDVWLDTQGNIRKGSLSMLGRPLDMIACSEACATAPTQSLNMMDSAVVDSPRLITPEMLADFLTYRVRIHNKAISKPFIATDEQSVADLGNGEWQINVYRGFIDAQDPPTPADTQPNAWLQSDAPEIKQLAALAAGNTSSTLHTLGNLNSFVSRYLTQRGLDIGYASALEVARDRRGNCAEFAVLLAALARARDIPARVVVGMLYTDRYDNKARVFVPHAWVIAWVGGRWRSFDPAAVHFDSGHIALDVGDGNPWHFFNATNEFGSIEIDAVHTFGEMYDLPPANISVGGAGGTGGGGSR